jgi:NADH dehydrogenase FAD-containing subunit
MRDERVLVLGAGLAGLAAAGAVSHDVAWWATLVALLFTWISGLDYFLSAPRLFRGQQPA